MVRRHALDCLGGFDENFRPAWFEDVDLCRRIHDMGGRIRFVPEARFVHHGGHTLAQLDRGEFREAYHRNQVRYFAKHHGPRTARRVHRLILAGLRLRAGLSFAFPMIEGMSRIGSARVCWQTAARIAAHPGEIR